MYKSCFATLRIVDIFIWFHQWFYPIVSTPIRRVQWYNSTSYKLCSPEERQIKYIDIHVVYLSSMTLWDIPVRHVLKLLCNTLDCTFIVTRYYSSNCCLSHHSMNGILSSIHKQFICVIVKNINILSSIATQ